MTRRACSILLFTVGCATVAPDELEADPPPLSEPVAASFAEELPFATEFVPDGRSLRVKRSIVVRDLPDPQHGRPIGTLAEDMRVTWVRAVTGRECDFWVEIAPRGWVCDRYLEANFRAPRARPLPSVEEGELLPGRYAKVTGGRVYATRADAQRGRGRRVKGSLTVQVEEEVRLRRRTFWRTSSGEYLEARHLRALEPSSFAGVSGELLKRRTVQVGWLQRRGEPRAGVPVHLDPREDGPLLKTLPARTVVEIQDTLDGWLRIDQGWVRRSDAHLARWMPPPAEVALGDRWLDVDLNEQVLVAYEGDRPVFATLVSTGKKGHETPEGLYRIWIKFAQTDMTGRMGDAAYRVSTVPWTMFFFDNYGLHTAYWHDRFGEPQSHGCINLSPQDARRLYHWTRPEVPDGWSMSYSSAERPGSWIQIRGAEQQRELASAR